MPYDWLNLWKASRVQKKTARTARAKWRWFDQPQVPDTVEKLLQVYKVESCQQQRRFSSCKHLSLVSFVNSFSVFRQLRSEFWHHCLFLSLQFTLIVELLFSNMHPSVTNYNSPIHTFLCIIPSGGFTYCTGLPVPAPKMCILCVRVKINSRQAVLLNVLRCQLTSWDQCRSMVEYSFTSTETRRLAQDGHLDFYTAPELSKKETIRETLV